MSARPILSATLGLALCCGTAGAQTVIERQLPPAESIDLQITGGSVRVFGRDEPAVSVRATFPADLSIEIKSSPSEIEIREHHPEGAIRVREVRYEIRTPRATRLTIASLEAAVEIAGIDSGIRVITDHGDVRIAAVSGEVSADTTTGSVTLDGVRGRAVLDTTSGKVAVRDLVGGLEITTEAGAVELSGIDADRVDVSTVRGDIAFDGVIRPHGHYSLASIRGSIELLLPAEPDVRLSVASATGSLTIDPTLAPTRPAPGEVSALTLGSGGAEIRLLTESGSIRVERRPPPEAPADERTPRREP